MFWDTYMITQKDGDVSSLHKSSYLWYREVVSVHEYNLVDNNYLTFPCSFSSFLQESRYIPSSLEMYLFAFICKFELICQHFQNCVFVILLQLCLFWVQCVCSFSSISMTGLILTIAASACIQNLIA
jgi:hypothetical protein